MNRSLTPRWREGLDNLLVPVCLSATHVAWGTMRFEPTWMMNIAESAACATQIAIKEGVTPGEINSDALVRRLAERHVMITFFNDLDIGDDNERAAAQYFGTQGFFSSYHARLDEPLTQAVKAAWRNGIQRLQEGTLNAMQLARTVRTAEQQVSPVTDSTRGAFLAAEFTRIEKTDRVPRCNSTPAALHTFQRCIGVAELICRVPHAVH